MDQRLLCSDVVNLQSSSFGCCVACGSRINGNVARFSERARVRFTSLVLDDNVDISRTHSRFNWPPKLFSIGLGKAKDVL